MTTTLDLFPETIATRRRRVIAHMIDAGQHLSAPVGARFECGRCGWKSDWLGFDTDTAVKKGVPCPRCNPSASAELSACGSYRWSLTRRYGDGPTAVIIGVNPSWADAEIDDPSVRRGNGFAERNGWGATVWVNLFALRSHDPSDLADHPHPVGPGADLHLIRAFASADLVIGAWGRANKAPRALRGRWREVALLAEREGAEILCWGTTKDGQPKHPLYLPYSAPLLPWERPR